MKVFIKGLSKLLVLIFVPFALPIWLIHKGITWLGKDKNQKLGNEDNVKPTP